MDFTSTASVDKLNKKLYHILALLTCSVCKKILNNPIASKCNHRFCERCFRSLSLTCPTCNVSGTKRYQTNLKMYLSSFRKLMDNLKKDINGNSADFAALYEFINSNSGKTFSQLKGQFVGESKDRTEHLSYSKDGNGYDPEETIIDEHFKPSLYSTVVQERFINHDASNIQKSVTPNIVDETKYPDKTLNYQKNVTPPIEDTFFQKSDVDLSLSDSSSDTSIEEQEKPMEGSSKEEPMITDNNPELGPNEINTYQTQSQYRVRKEITAITYSHKQEDKFDRVVKQSSKLANESTTASIQSSTNQSASRTRSPELFNLSDSDSDDSLFNYQ